MVRAATAESSHRDPVATSAHFLAPTKPGPVQVALEPVGAGRTASTMRAVLLQEGKPKIAAHITLATLGDHPPDYQSRRPEVPPPAECVPRPTQLPDGNPVRFLESIEVRIDPGHRGGPLRELSGVPEVPEVRGWIRARDGTPPDAVFLAFCVDALPPTVLELGGQGWSPTVQLSTYIRARPAPGWLCVVARASMVADGWFDEEAEVWDSRGRLVAQGRQVGRYRLGPDPAPDAPDS